MVAEECARKGDEEEDLYKSSGCVITADDEPNVAASVVCCLCFVAYGASAAGLGPALPTLATHFHKTTSQLGMAFTIRGLGYLAGTVGSAGVLSIDNNIFSKEMMTCIALVVTGVTCGVVASTDSFGLALACFFVQGIGFGGVDTMANCVLPELWGRRVQPWMQAMHSCFGFGAVIGPTLVGALSYRAAFNFIALASFSPLVLLLSYKFVKSNPCQPAAEHVELEHGNETDNKDAGVIAPLFLQLMVCYFFFTYVGAETGFAGWVPSYALDEGITTSPSQAAYLSSIFWAALTAGRVLAVPAAVFISATAMIRIQLAMIVVCCLAGLVALRISYPVACIVCGFMGFSLSSIFPVMMTLFGDYGFAMDGTTTSMFMLGATFGESIVPILMGWAMELVGPWAMPLMVFLSALVLVADYLLVHHFSTKGKATSLPVSTDNADWGNRSQHALLTQFSPVHKDEEELDAIEMTSVQFVEEA